MNLAVSIFNPPSSTMNRPMWKNCQTKDSQQNTNDLDMTLYYREQTEPVLFHGVQRQQASLHVYVWTGSGRPCDSTLIRDWRHADRRCQLLTIPPYVAPPSSAYHPVLTHTDSHSYISEKRRFVQILSMARAGRSNPTAKSRCALHRAGPTADRL